MISYIGGKSRMAKWICEYIPENIETYVEVFGGAFWVYIKGNIHEKPKLKKVIYNDKNIFMSNLFVCLQNPKEFAKQIKDIEPQQKEFFEYCQEQLNIIKNYNIPFEMPSTKIASQYVYVATQVFSGSKILESKFIDLKGKYNSKFDAFRNRLNKTEIIEKLENITRSENLDYTDIILKYDSPTTFFYVDPPYWKTENYYSNHDFDSEDHLTLCTHLKKIKGKFALSYYDFPLLSKWLPKKEFNWKTKEFKKAAGAIKGKKQNKSIELLIMNYEN